jgi:glycosyltransferase involved in cell wall biosynthesis
VGASFHESFGIAPDRITPVHAGPNCDVTRIPARPAARGQHAPTILFIGRQFERKGGELLLRAFERVRSKVADAELLIVGPSEMPEPPPGVTCLGFINKDRPGGWEAISAAYERADVFCLPTKFEPFGIVFVEAMHFGVPCLGPNAWAVPEIIVDGETGFTFPPDDEAALAERLVTMLSDPNLAHSMGMASRDRARERFTWEAVGAKMDHALTSLLGLQAAHV